MMFDDVDKWERRVYMCIVSPWVFIYLLVNTRYLPSRYEVVEVFIIATYLGSSGTE